MSLASFKRKSVVRYGTNKSGKPPGGFWLPQGPFGASVETQREAYRTFGAAGFSINGPHRNVGGVGQDMKMSHNGTPFRGQHPIGHGGTFGHYAPSQPVFPVNRVITQGQQWLYIKPSVLSTRGMLQQKYRWAYSGQYPNVWVQPNYAHTNQSQTKSQGMYVHTKTTDNMCVTDVNQEGKYVDNIKGCGPNLCGSRTSTAHFKYNDLARNGQYGKQLHTPEISSIHTLRIQRRCTNPVGPQKPFPYATNGDSCNPFDINVLAPPAWYVTPTAGELANEVAQAATRLRDNQAGAFATTSGQFGV